MVLLVKEKESMNVSLACKRNVGTTLGWEILMLIIEWIFRTLAESDNHNAYTKGMMIPLVIADPKEIWEFVVKFCDSYNFIHKENIPDAHLQKMYDAGFLDGELKKYAEESIGMLRFEKGQ